jgi:hypothetical protein
MPDQTPDDDAMRTQFLDILAEAAGAPAAGSSEDVDPEQRRWLIDHLESLGYLTARTGDAGEGEDEDEFFITGITNLGRDLLDLLLRRRAQEKSTNT